jgi:catechol 2,3-dioxygenase
MTQRFDSRTALISTGDYHHLIGLNTRDNLGGSAPAPNTSGLYHIAILYRSTLGRRAAAAKPSTCATPDGVALWLCWDLPKEWPRTADDNLNAIAKPLNPDELLKVK